MSRTGAFCTVLEKGIRLTVKVRPGASKVRELRLVDVGEGRQALEISVSAPPEGGRANEAVCRSLAKILSLPFSNLSIVAGQTGRLKIVEARGGTPHSLLAVERLLSETNETKTKKQRPNE